MLYILTIRSSSRGTGQVSESRPPGSAGFRNILIFRPVSPRKRLVRVRHAGADVIVRGYGGDCGRSRRASLKTSKGRGKTVRQNPVGKRINLSRQGSPSSSMMRLAYTCSTFGTGLRRKMIVVSREMFCRSRVAIRKYESF